MAAGSAPSWALTWWSCAPRWDLRGEDKASVAEFDVDANESVDFVLTWGPSHLPPPPPFDAVTALADTERFWAGWSADCRYQGPWRTLVLRSLLTLKALTFAPTGGIAAALTTSLPEQLGGSRNWDYRYCWLRDATLTLVALMEGGYTEEARAWRAWLQRAVAGNPDELQIMYGLAGERQPPSGRPVGWPAIRERPRFASATRPPSSCSSTSMARSPPRCTSRASTPIPATCRLGDASGVSRASGNDLGRARRRHLGGARRAAAVHAFEGHGLGCR